MKRLLDQRPSPALVISMIALFVAMSGTGYALSRASVGPKQLKRSAVTTSKIKKRAVTASKLRRRAVTTSKIKNDNVTGRKIKESTLGKVPDADKLDGLDSPAYERSSKFTRIQTLNLGNNEARDIYSLGPFRLTAHCQLNQAGNDEPRILITTTQDNAAFDGNDSGVLNVATPEASREFVKDSTAAGTPGIDAENDGTAIAADGTQFVSQLWAAVNTFNQPGRCFFGGLIEQVS